MKGLLLYCLGVLSGIIVFYLASQQYTSAEHEARTPPSPVAPSAPHLVQVQKHKPPAATPKQMEAQETMSSPSWQEITTNLFMYGTSHPLDQCDALDQLLQLGNEQQQAFLVARSSRMELRQLKSDFAHIIGYEKPSTAKMLLRNFDLSNTTRMALIMGIAQAEPNVILTLTDQNELPEYLHALDHKQLSMFTANALLSMARDKNMQAQTLEAINKLADKHWLETVAFRPAMKRLANHNPHGLLQIAAEETESSYRDLMFESAILAMIPESPNQALDILNENMQSLTEINPWEIVNSYAYYGKLEELYAFSDKIAHLEARHSFANAISSELATRYSMDKSIDYIKSIQDTETKVQAALITQAFHSRKKTPLSDQIKLLTEALVDVPFDEKEYLMAELAATWKTKEPEKVADYIRSAALTKEQANSLEQLVQVITNRKTRN